MSYYKKRAKRIITFSNYNDRTNPLFKLLGIITFSDLVFLLNVIFVYDFTSANLPPAFDDLFMPVYKKHNYNTRLASWSSCSLPLVRTNYGKSNIRFLGAKLWNYINNGTKYLMKLAFKKKLKQDWLSPVYSDRLEIHLKINK